MTNKEIIKELETENHNLRLKLHDMNLADSIQRARIRKLTLENIEQEKKIEELEKKIEELTFVLDNIFIS